MLLHHCFGEVNGKKGVWGHAIGGMGAITQAMAKAAGAHGVEIDTGAAVSEVIVENGRATGVVLGDGTRIDAQGRRRQRQSKAPFERLVPRGAVPGFVTERMRRWKARLRHVPHERRAVRAAEFRRPARQRRPPHLRDHSGANLAYMDRAYPTTPRTAGQPGADRRDADPLDARRQLAPPGPHVASLFCQHVAPDLPDEQLGRNAKVADLMVDTVDRYAPGFRASVIGRQIFSPRDLERTFGLPDGDIFHGALSMDQIFSARPMLGSRRLPHAAVGLYICGSGAHPGGGVTGAPGHNAAAAVIADLKR